MRGCACAGRHVATTASRHGHAPAASWCACFVARKKDDWRGVFLRWRRPRSRQVADRRHVEDRPPCQPDRATALGGGAAAPRGPRVAPPGAPSAFAAPRRAPQRSRALPPMQATVSPACTVADMRSRRQLRNRGGHEFWAEPSDGREARGRHVQRRMRAARAQCRDIVGPDRKPAGAATQQ